MLQIRLVPCYGTHHATSSACYLVAQSAGELFDKALQLIPTLSRWMGEHCLRAVSLQVCKPYGWLQVETFGVKPYALEDTFEWVDENGARLFEKARNSHC